MNGQIYLQTIENRLSAYFDVKSPTNESLAFNFVAEMNSADEGYFLLPSIKTYSVKHNEYLYIRCFNEEISFEVLNKYLAYIKGKMQYLKPNTEHMSSIFALVLVCENGISQEAVKYLEKYKYHKDYCFTLKGWSDLAVLTVDLTSETLYYNKVGQKISSSFKVVPSEK